MPHHWPVPVIHVFWESQSIFFLRIFLLYLIFQSCQNHLYTFLWILMHFLRKGMQVSWKFFIILILFNQKFFLINRIPAGKVDESQSFNLRAQSLMIYYDLLIIWVGQKHLLLEDLTDRLTLITGNDLHPLLQTFPLPKSYEKFIFTNLIKSLHFLKPFFYWNKLRRLWTDELTHSFTTERIIILNLFVDYLGIRYDLHVVVIVLMFADHVDEFISC